ncbi:MAG: aldehyde dehydrogenase family protein, partial [Gammaproteobacteria bacterium]|nr:aldehyde dehydrogenase family protein [Gammaproteobacteria bacterium]
MTTLLTRAEYQAIAEDLNLPCNAFIDGKFRAAKSKKTFASINPATGKTIAKIAACDAKDVDFAVKKAREAFDDGRWCRLHPGERKEILIRLTKLMKRNSHELAVMESLDSGKPVRDCETIDLPETIHCLIWHAEAIDKIYDQSAPVGDNAMAIVVREPVGVVGCVLPWNFPMLMMAWKIAPALAAGNAVILKPAEQTSLTALRIAELALEAGLPRGVLNVIPGMGPDVGEPMGRHPGIDMLSFTGSTETGRRFLHYSADSNLKKIVLECGGKNPAIVLEDAEDLDLVAEHVVNGAFWNMGENCSASSRLIVHEAVKDKLMKRIIARTRNWKTGDPLDPRHHLGALVDKEHFKKVSGYLKR